MKKIVIEILLLSVIAAVFAIIVNSVSSTGIPLMGTWYDNRKIVILEKPISYDPETDSLLSMQEAFILWNGKKVIFIDTREPDEFNEGHIPGAINLPFEEWDDYWDQVKDYLYSDAEIVCYCGGLDCELSLFAARELKAIGYPNSYIFFGGFTKWMEFELPFETNHEN